MSLLGFGNIEFGPDGREGFGPLAALENGSDEFKNDNFRYPNDVGAFDKGHYMMFFIREQDKTNGKGAARDLQTPGMGANGLNEGAAQYYNAMTGSEIGSKLASGASRIKSAAGDLGGSFTSKISSFTGAGGSLGGFDTGSISSSLGSFGNKLKGGVSSIFGQSNILKANEQSSAKIMDTRIGSIEGERFLTTTVRTTENIALYMPDTLMYNHTQTYSSLSLGKGPAATVVAAGESIADAKEKSGETGISGTISAIKSSKALEMIRDAGAKAILEGVANAGGLNGKIISQAAIGQVTNPMLEMVYTSPNFRKFQFDFFFYPRDEAEALQVQNILDRFKYHQAPEYGQKIDMAKSSTLRPPSEFDIKFYYGQGQNPNIPQIAEGCVLETIDVNYAPNGAQFYEVPGENIASRGRTGMPVGVQLTLNFAETSILTKNDLKHHRSGGNK